MSRSLPAILFAALVCTACAVGEPAATEPNLTPAFAKPAPAAPAPEVDFHFLPSSGFGVSGDDLPVYASTLNGITHSLYKEPICGVTTNLFNASADASGDMVMQTNGTSTRSTSCADYPRRLVVRYGADGNYVVDRRPAFVNLRGISRPGLVIPVGVTVERAFSIQRFEKGAGCDQLRFNSDNPVGSGGSKVEVTRLDERTYHVKSKPGGKAYCAEDGKLYDLTVEFTAIASVDLPVQ